MRKPQYYITLKVIWWKAYDRESKEIRETQRSHTFHKRCGIATKSAWRFYCKPLENLSTGFAKLAILSCLIAIPIAWFQMNIWLQEYQYRTNIPVWIFVASGLVTLVITLLTVSYQSIKASLTNPVV